MTFELVFSLKVSRGSNVIKPSQGQERDFESTLGLA